MNFAINRRISKKIVVIVAILFIIYFLIHLILKPKTPALPPTKVVVLEPQWKEITEYVTQTGTLVAINSVDLVARVEGYLRAIEFIDGAFVTKGQELFIIQPEPYLEQLKGATATVAAQKANFAYTKSEYARQKKMYKSKATSLNNVEIWLAKTQEAQAEIDKAVANEVIAAINYSYTHILSPFDGRIGRHLVDIGNLVGNGVATTLATVEQINPIYAYFNLNEIDLLKLRESARAQGFKVTDLSQIPVYVKLQNETTFSRKGKLDFVNTGLNAGTGTMEFRALLDNADFVLLPGLFVQVRIPITQPKKELTIPGDAVLYDQAGSYVLTVNKKNIVQLKRVKLGSADLGIQAIIGGLTQEDKVIVAGLQFATPGNEVVVQNG